MGGRHPPPAPKLFQPRSAARSAGAGRTTLTGLLDDSDDTRDARCVGEAWRRLRRTQRRWHDHSVRLRRCVSTPDADLFVGNAGTATLLVATLALALAVPGASYRVDGVPRIIRATNWRSG